MIQKQSKHTALIGWDHVLNIYIGVFPSMLLQHLQRLLNQLRQILILPLRIVNLISYIDLVTTTVPLLFLNMLKTGRICR